MESDREFEGVFENGVVRINADDTPPDGTRVSVRIIERKSKLKPNARAAHSKSSRRKGPASAEKRHPAEAGDAMASGIPEIMKFAGCIKGLPPDASTNVDHYLYGAPKRRRRKKAKSRP